MSPKFNPNNKSRKGDDDEEKDEALVVPDAWVEPRCHVCMSKFRPAVDRMIALGTPYTEISRIFGGEIDRRSIKNHSDKHLGWEDSAIQRIVQRQAREMQEDFEEGVSGALNRRVFLEAFVQKSVEKLISGSMPVEAKDTLQAIQVLEKLDMQSEGTAIDEIKMQFNAFLQAFRELSEQDLKEIETPQDLQMFILTRVQNLLANTSEVRDTPQLES